MATIKVEVSLRRYPCFPRGASEYHPPEVRMMSAGSNGTKSQRGQPSNIYLLVLEAGDLENMQPIKYK